MPFFRSETKHRPSEESVAIESKDVEIGQHLDEVIPCLPTSDKSERDFRDYSLRELTAGEIKVVRSGARLVYVVLIVVGIALTLATYFFLSNANEKKFESEFHSYARETADIAEKNAENTLLHLKNLATAITSVATDSYFRPKELGFPNVTIPHFDIRAEDSSGAEMVLFVPLVEAQSRIGWEHYVNEKQAWVVEEGDLNEMGSSSNTTKTIFDCPFCDAINDTRRGYVDVDEFMEQILESRGYQPDGISAPIVQYRGSSTYDSSLVMFDLFSHPIFKKEMVASLEYDVPVISEATDVGFIMASTEKIRDSHDCHPDHHEDTSHHEHVFRSFILYPVKESFEKDARITGFVIGVVPWSAFFDNILALERSQDAAHAKNISGLVVKVVSDCGSTFTYVINGGKCDITREGDWHDIYMKYEHIFHTSQFFYREHPTGLSRHCHFDLHIYPSYEFHAMYDSNEPILYAGMVLLIFLCSGILFYIYNGLVFERQKKVMSHASSMVIANARRAARNERDLNDFIAHEVRNPLAAAMSAFSFVSAAVLDENKSLIESTGKRESVEEDMKIIDSSLHFINDLLRNMLDLHRASSNQMKLDWKPTQLMDDIFKPVANMLHIRDANFKVLLACPDNLILSTDTLRLKQVMLNLARNAVKFVERGFIRLQARLDDKGKIQLSVEDSGPGIPLEKREQLFGKFQDTLDSLNQGTGIGLNLCKKLTDLMGARLYIDENYESGVPGCPGTRFVIDMNRTPQKMDDEQLDARCESLHSLNVSSLANRDSFTRTTELLAHGDTSSRTLGLTTRSVRCDRTSTPEKSFDDEGCSFNESSDVLIDILYEADPTQDKELPEELSVLFVDDDMVLRKLFARSLQKLAPGWTVKEAANGEIALQMAESESFDLIFMDQYMASVQKQLLGTETVRALRAQGVHSTICGLSANDVEVAFAEAGANAFMFKPFPCKQDLLTSELLRILFSGSN